MMRLALLAAVAVVAGAHDATAAVAAAKAAMGEVSWAEARCMLSSLPSKHARSSRSRSCFRNASKNDAVCISARK